MSEIYSNLIIEEVDVAHFVSDSYPNKNNDLSIARNEELEQAKSEDSLAFDATAHTNLIIEEINITTANSK